MALGIDTFILSGYPHLEEAYRFAELVFPLLPLAQRRATAPTSVNTGPFGETIANDHRRRRRRRPSHEHAARDRSAPAERPRRSGRCRSASSWSGRPRRCRLISGRVLPAPTDVARRRLATAPRAASCSATSGSALARARRASPSAAASASPSALANGLSQRSETGVRSTLQMVRNIPHLALIPLVILWFGIDEEAKIFLVALGVFFPIYINTQHGIRTVDPQLVEMGRTYGMSPATLFWRVILPGALPSIFVGLRYALGIMWLTLIVAETIAASSGIGYMAMQAREFLLVDVVVLSILIYALLGKLADSAARLLERAVPVLASGLPEHR